MAQKGISDRIDEQMNQADEVKDLLILCQRSCHLMTDQWGFEFSHSPDPFKKQLIDTIHAMDSILFDLIPKAEKIHDELDNISVALAQEERKEPQPTAKQN